MKFFRSVAVTCLIALGAIQSGFAQVTLPQLDPQEVDTSHKSTASPGAFIDFINVSAVGVDIYWINYEGDRVLYKSNLTPGASHQQPTYLTHPWLAVVSGTGGSTVEGTGSLIGAFLPQTINPSFNPSLIDIAYIGAVPEPSAALAIVFGLPMIGYAAHLRKKRRNGHSA